MLSSPSSSHAITAIIGYRGYEENFEAFWNDLKLWFSDIVVVGEANAHLSKNIKAQGGTWIDHPSLDIGTLWEVGIRACPSDTYLLLKGTEFLSTKLKESILNKIRASSREEKIYPFQTQKFYLKQRMKYPLEGDNVLSSGLLFIAEDKRDIRLCDVPVSSERLPGESIQFGETTLAHALKTAVGRSEQFADNLYRKNPHSNAFALCLKGLMNVPFLFFKHWILRRGMREGFEGLTFSLLESVSALTGYFRYYEKYVRSGHQIGLHLPDIKKVLIIKCRGLGDAVLATPTIKNLKILAPHVSISVITLNFCKPIFENNPHIDALYGLSGTTETAETNQLIKTLNTQNIDLIINLHSKNFTSRLAKKIRARWKIQGSYFLRERNSDVMIGSSSELDKPSIEKDLDCLRAIGLVPKDKQPELFLTEQEIEHGQRILSEKGIDPAKKLIIIHPAVTQPLRHWGMDRFVELSQNLINKHGCLVMGVFSEQEQSIADELTKKVDGIFIYVGPIRPSMAVFHHADVMIDNDSGPSHISQALGIPTLVLVGPDYQNTYRNKEIYRGNNFVFFKSIPCRDLYFSKCLPPAPCENRICLDHSVEDVIQETLRLSQKKVSQSHSA
jgi:ADP-heptose:LPS heptosyltransferase